MLPESVSASRSSACVAALVSSNIAAFCWVPRSSSLTAELISSSPTDCSCAEVARLATLPRMSCTYPAICSKAEPLSSTSRTPDWICSKVEATRFAISRELSDDRSASCRTSEATTAKPRPLSPARAASTPAFSASRLVWKAISSITPVMFDTCSELAAMPFIASTARRDISSPLAVLSSAARAVWAASPALAAAARTDEVISSSAAAVSSSAAACFSVRRLRSRAAAEIWPVSVRIASARPEMPEITSARARIERLNSSFSWANSCGTSPAISTPRSWLASCVTACWKSRIARFCALMSVANFTTLATRPSVSRIGL